MDAFALPWVEQVGVIKPAQIGWSETERNIIGHCIDLDPGPMLILCPDKPSCEHYVEENLRPLLSGTPAVAAHKTGRAWDITLDTIRLDTMSIFMAHGGSSQAVKSRPIRYLSVQEPDEVPDYSGAGGSPIAKAEKRLATYRDKGKSRMLIGGTPTTRKAFLWRWWESCPDRRRFEVPCPYCHQYQQLVRGAAGDSGGGLKWTKLNESDRGVKADAIESGNLAYYQCEHCSGKIFDHHKPAMLRAGKWLGEDQVITPDGRVVGPERRAKRIGFRINALYSPWVSFSMIAAEIVRSVGDIGRTVDLVNQTFAEPFEDQTSEVKIEDVERKAEEAKGVPRDVVPKWAMKIFATVDSQKAGFWYLIRAWGYRYRSQLIRYGFLNTLDEVWNTCVMQPYPFEGGGMMRPELLLIDRGGGTQNEENEKRTDEVDRFAERAPGFIVPIIGAAHDQAQTVRFSPRKNKAGQPLGLYTLHTNRLKDELVRHMRLPAGAEGEWSLNGGVGEDYVRMMASERKIVINPRTGEQAWKAYSANHIWDLEVYQFGAADPSLGAVNLIMSPEDAQKIKDQQAKITEEQKQRAASRENNWRGDISAWRDRNPR